MFGVVLSADEDEARADMAVPVVLPLPARRVVAMARRQRPVRSQSGRDAGGFAIDGSGKAALAHAAAIPPESSGPPNRPHGGRWLP